MRTFLIHAAAMLLLSISPSLLISQRSVLLADFDHKGHERYFGYCQSDHVKWEGELQFECRECIKKGTGAAEMIFTFQPGEYCGWGLMLRDSVGGYDLSNTSAKFITFWLKRTVNTDFQVKLKDIEGQENQVLASAYLGAFQPGWQKVKIPIEAFGDINLSAIENLNFGFNAELAAEGENKVWIDELALTR